MWNMAEQTIVDVAHVPICYSSVVHLQMKRSWHGAIRHVDMENHTMIMTLSIKPFVGVDNLHKAAHTVEGPYGAGS